MSEPEPKAQRDRGTLTILLALFAVYAIWGSTYLAMRVALETVPPFLMSGPRFLVAGTAMYAYLRLRSAPRPTRAEWGASAKIGVAVISEASNENPCPAPLFCSDFSSVPTLCAVAAE